MKTLWFFCFLFLGVSSLSKGDLQDKDLRRLDSASWNFLQADPDSTIRLSEIQKELAIKKGNNYYLANAYFKIGYAQYHQDYFDLAAVNYYTALNILEKNSLDFKKAEYVKMYLFQCLGLVYEKTFDYKLASEYYAEGLLIAKKFENRKYTGALNYNLGVAHELNENFENALDHYLQAEAIYAKASYEIKLAKVHNSIGNVYNKTGRYDKAKSHYLLALEIARANDLQREVDTYISNLGENAFKQNKYELAKKYYTQALEISESLKDLEKIKWLNNNLGDVYFEEKNFEKAIACYQKSIALGTAQNIDDELKRSFKNIARAYDATGNYQLASAYKDKYMGQVELLAQTKNNLQEQNARYRMREVEWQMERLAKNEKIEFYKTSVFWFRISLSFIVLTLIYISYFTYKYRRKIIIARRLLNY